MSDDNEPHINSADRVLTELDATLRALVSSLAQNKDLTLDDLGTMISPLLDPEELEFIGDHIARISKDAGDKLTTENRLLLNNAYAKHALWMDLEQGDELDEDEDEA